MKKKCPTCGAAVVEYRHTFSKPLAQGLLRLFKARAPVNLKFLGLTRNQWDNFQKLRYWDLVQKYCENGKRVGGAWEITPRGTDFLTGKINIHRVVWTYRGERVRYDEGMISFGDAHGSYLQREDYAATAQPRLV